MPEADISHLIEQNLAAYFEANATSAPSDYKVKRELNIARHALEEGLAVYQAATSVIKTALSKLDQTPEGMLKIITLCSHLEERSTKLVQNTKSVANIAKTGAEIEMMLASKLDIVQIYSILSQLPALLLTILQSQLTEFFRSRNLTVMNGKILKIEEVVQEASNVIINVFNEEIEKSVNLLTYSTAPNDTTPRGVIEAEVVAMLNTVPLQPTEATVIDSADELAKQIKST